MDVVQAVLAVAVFVAILVAVALIMILPKRLAKKRSAEWGRQAVSQGWHYTEQDTGLARQWKGSPFTGGGTARDIITGTHRGRGVSCFTYVYTTSGTRSNETRVERYAVFVVMLPAPVPELSVGAEGLFGGKVAEKLGFKRVDLDDEAFNDVFKVKCNDEQFARMVLQPAVVRQLKLTGPWDWRFTDQVMISYESGSLHLDDVKPRLDLMCDLLDAIPDTLWQRRPPVRTTE